MTKEGERGSVAVWREKMTPALALAPKFNDLFVETISRKVADYPPSPAPELAELVSCNEGGTAFAGFVDGVGVLKGPHAGEHDDGALPIASGRG